MWLDATQSILSKSAAFLTNILLVVASTILALMMFLTATDVALRYVFSSPLPGAFELVEYMMAVLVPFALVFCAHQKAHIGVDLVIERLPKGTQKVIGWVTGLLTLILFLFMTWQSFFYVVEQYHSKLTSAVLLIPRYPFVAMCTFAFAVFSLVMVVQVFDLMFGKKS